MIEILKQEVVLKDRKLNRLIHSINNIGLKQTSKIFININMIIFI